MLTKRFRFEVRLAIGLLVLFAAVWLWQSPGILGHGLTPGEIDRYLGAIAARAPLEPAKKASSLQRLRTWAEADDGRPVYMLNLMRFYPAVRPIPGAGDWAGRSPVDANRYYETHVAPLLLQVGGLPQFAGTPQGRNVLDSPAAVDDWSRVLVVRYPSRRAFLQLVANPAYAPLAPYKMMAAEVSLVPLAGEAVIPDVRWLLAGDSWCCSWRSAGTGLRHADRTGDSVRGGHAQRLVAPTSLLNSSASPRADRHGTPWVDHDAGRRREPVLPMARGPCAVHAPHLSTAAGQPDRRPARDRRPAGFMAGSLRDAEPWADRKR
jgi:hypothetical protein